MPTAHELAAAVLVARFIDQRGNAQSDAHASYAVTATDMGFAPSALRAGEGILIAAGLLRLESGRLIPTTALGNFVAISDEAEASRTLERIVEQTSDDLARAEAGAAGEEFVLNLVRENLTILHRADLAERCERVSLISDWFGYDVSAPTLGEAVRRLEVKTQSADPIPATFRFYLSRNEYDVGRANPNEWALVACALARESPPTLLGWCRASTLSAYLPVDQGGKWTEALVSIPRSVLTPGFPSSV